MSILASWYREQENNNSPVVVIIYDLEQCCGSVLSDFILMLRYSTASCHLGRNNDLGSPPSPPHQKKKKKIMKLVTLNSITQEFYKEVMKENIKTVKMCNID